MSRVGERQAHLWGTALHPSQADGKGGRWTEWERDSATWYGLAAPVGAVRLPSLLAKLSLCPREGSES